METGCAGAEHMVLSFHRAGESGVSGLGKSTRGVGSKQGQMADSCGGKVPEFGLYSDFISVLKGRSLCHFFICFSKVL